MPVRHDDAVLPAAKRQQQQHGGGGDGADNAAKEQAELMTLKALSTIFFAFLALSLYFTPFLVGREWGALVAEMYALPDIDLTKALSVLGNLELALTWPEMEWHIEMPALLSVGVLFLELTSRVVGYVYKTYLSKFQIREAHFRRPMLPVNAAVWLGLKAQTGFQVMWDAGLGAGRGACRARCP